MSCKDLVWVAMLLLALMACATTATSATSAAEVIVAEGESFDVPDGRGWRVTGQNDSYASHTYGGMWMTHGGCLGAPPDSVASTASQKVTVSAAGEYRVWSKYQAPPFFNYMHRIEIVQQGKTVYSHVYGRVGTERLWSFSGASDELWWPWGIDHDAAEAPQQTVQLAVGPAEIRLITVPNAAPAGDRFVDFVLLTTNLADDYHGYQPYAVASPFINEALAATRLYLRFRNSASDAAKLTVTRPIGHFQPNYGRAVAMYPQQPVPPAQWSPWFNIGPFCRLVHNDTLQLSLPGVEEVAVQIARDEAGEDLVGDLTLTEGDALIIPIDVTWNRSARAGTGRQHAEQLIALTKTWRKANGGRKPQDILFFGNVHGATADRVKDALGYNTELPDQYEHAPQHRWVGHAKDIAAIKTFADDPQRDSIAVVSFGDEISVGEIDYADPEAQAPFRAWLKARGLTQDDLGIPLAQATLTRAGNPRLVWYSNLFSEERVFADFRARTTLAEEVVGPHVLTGANYSPHHLALNYGPIGSWVDLFKHRGMSMFWSEDYIFSVPEVPQSVSWMMAQARRAVKYNGQPIHMYIMPHAPGQIASLLRTNMLAAVGYGARHINSFCAAGQEAFTENYVAWGYNDTFRAIHDAIYDTAEAEALLVGGTLRPARVAVVTGKATDFNESRLMADKTADPFASRCRNAPAQLNQILCRKDQQMLYLALRQAQHAVDLITEDDIVDRDELARYEVVYFAGQWIDHRVVPKLDAWVRRGGILYATAGIGHLNQFGEREPSMLELLGLKDAKLTSNAVVIRTLLELPLLGAIDTITLDGEEIAAVAMRQQLLPDRAKVLATWSDGSAAVTVRDHGRGKAFAVGTLAGNTYMKTGLKVQPFARGGRKTVYHPVDFDRAATKLVRLGIDALPLVSAAVCSDPCVEAVVMDHPRGTLVTLLNWTNAPLPDLKVAVQLPAAPSMVRSVRLQQQMPVTYADGVATLNVELVDADYLLLLK